MPWGDCIGPSWTGSGENRTGNYDFGCRRAYGRVASCGRRLCRRFGANSRQPSAEDERNYLEAVARDLETKLKNVRDRIEQLHSMPGSMENVNMGE